MKLLDTTITYRDSCKTYPLKRIGLGYLIDWNNDTPTIKELCESSLFEHVDIPEVGCILIWMNKTIEDYSVPHKITKDGKIISIPRRLYGHCALFESDEMISDIAIVDNYGELRMRHYCDVPKPDYILKLKYS